MSKRALSLIGLCRKAGKLIAGYEAVREAAASGKAEIIITAADLSLKSRKEAAHIAQKYNTEHIAARITMDELSFWLGRRAGILAVADKELAKAVRNAVSRENEEEQLI